MPLAFTEHGAIKAATVLNTPRAVEISVYLVRAFVRLRELAAIHSELTKRLDELEHKTEVMAFVLWTPLWTTRDPCSPARSVLSTTETHNREAPAAELFAIPHDQYWRFRGTSRSQNGIDESAAMHAGQPVYSGA